MRRRSLAVATMAAFAAGPATALAQDPPRLRTYVDRFTTTEPAAPSGRHTESDMVDPHDPEGKPPAFERVTVRLHPGARWDTGAVARCEASDLELILAGPAACPGESLVGGGRIDLDTGFTGPARILPHDFTLINARDQLILLGRNRASGAHVPLRGRVSENVLEIDVPPLPGTPPDGGASTAEVLEWAVAGRYLTTPAVCPESGEWTNTVTYVFRDGVVQSFSAGSPCSARAGTPAARRRAARKRARPARRACRRAKPRARRGGDRERRRSCRARKRRG